MERTLHEGGESPMKKHFILLFLCISFGLTSKASANMLEEVIIRKVLLDVVYFSETHTVKAYYLKVVDRPGEDPQVTVGSTKTIQYDEKKEISEESLATMVESDTDLYYDIFVSDLIFGKEAHVYDDARGRKLSEEDIEQYKNNIIESNKKYINNPPSQEELYMEIDQIMKEKGIESHFRKLTFFDYLTLPSTLLLIIICLLVAVNFKPILKRIRRKSE